MDTSFQAHMAITVLRISGATFLLFSDIVKANDGPKIIRCEDNSPEEIVASIRYS